MHSLTWAQVWAYRLARHALLEPAPAADLAAVAGTVCGIHAQVMFPNSIGLGGQGLASAVQDPALRRLCIQIYNDAMAEVQADSGNRLPEQVCDARHLKRLAAVAHPLRRRPDRQASGSGEEWGVQPNQDRSSIVP